MSKSKIRHICKSLTWRLIASIDTFLISFFISSDINLSITISMVEIVTKIILYYFHERIWFNSKIKNHRIRHLIKPFTWRIVGTIDTFIISSLIFGNIFLGLKLVSIETLTKLLLYYLHEKIWYKINFGLDGRR